MNTKDKKSLWEKQLDDTINQILTRPKFEYDMNSDKLYEQYKTHYKKQGELAAENAMGQASAMTGGYGNSYAQTVGQQTYQNYMNELNNIVPDLYANARSEYDAKTNDLYNDYAFLTQLLGATEDNSATKNNSQGAYTFIYDALNEFETEAEARDYLMGLVGDKLTAPEAEYYYTLYKNGLTVDENGEVTGGYIVNKEMDEKAKSFDNEKQFGAWIDASLANGSLTQPQAEAYIDKYMTYYQGVQAVIDSANVYSSYGVLRNPENPLLSPYHTIDQKQREAYEDMLFAAYLAGADFSEKEYDKDNFWKRK